LGALGQKQSRQGHTSEQQKHGHQGCTSELQQQQEQQDQRKYFSEQQQQQQDQQRRFKK